MEFGCYRVTIEDPIVSGPGQEWDQEWAVPHSKGTMCNVRPALFWTRQRNVGLRRKQANT